MNPDAPVFRHRDHRVSVPTLPLPDLHRALAAERATLASFRQALDMAEAEAESLRHDLRQAHLERDRALLDAARLRRASRRRWAEWSWRAGLCCLAGGALFVGALRAMGL